MIIINDFEYFKPKTLTEALELLAQKQPDVRLLAGGTDLIVHMKEDLAKPANVIDLKGLDQFNEISFADNYVILGAGVTFTDLIESERIKNELPILWEASEKVASVGVRNRATLVGNICSAVPSADSAPPLLVYNAEVIVKNLTAERSIPIEEWFLSPRKTSLKPDEIVISIKIPLETHCGAYEKLGRYKGEDLAQAGIGIFVDGQGKFRFANCAVGPIPRRMKKLEDFVNQSKPDSLDLDEAAKLILQEISPITDIRSSAEYREHMMQVMFKRGVKRSLACLKGGEK